MFEIQRIWRNWMRVLPEHIFGLHSERLFKKKPVAICEGRSFGQDVLFFYISWIESYKVVGNLSRSSWIIFLQISLYLLTFASKQHSKRLDGRKLQYSFFAQNIDSAVRNFKKMNSIFVFWSILIGWVKMHWCRMSRPIRTIMYESCSSGTPHSEHPDQGLFGECHQVLCSSEALLCPMDIHGSAFVLRVAWHLPGRSLCSF